MVSRPPPALSRGAAAERVSRGDGFHPWPTSRGALPSRPGRARAFRTPQPQRGHPRLEPVRDALASPGYPRCREISPATGAAPRDQLRDADDRQESDSLVSAGQLRCMRGDVLASRPCGSRPHLAACNAALRWLKGLGALAVVVSEIATADRTGEARRTGPVPSHQASGGYRRCRNEPRRLAHSHYIGRSARDVATPLACSLPECRVETPQARAGRLKGVRTPALAWSMVPLPSLHHPAAGSVKVGEHDHPEQPPTNLVFDDVSCRASAPARAVCPCLGCVPDALQPAGTHLGESRGDRRVPSGGALCKPARAFPRAATDQAGLLDT